MIKYKIDHKQSFICYYYSAKVYDDMAMRCGK